MWELTKIANDFKLSTILSKLSIIDFWEGSKYVSEVFYPLPYLKIEIVLNELQGISFHLKRTSDFKNLFRVFFRVFLSFRFKKYSVKIVKV